MKQLLAAVSTYWSEREAKEIAAELGKRAFTSRLLEDGNIELERNSGALHAQIGATSVRIKEREVELSKGLLGYALPGRSREWQLPSEVAAGLPAPLAIQAMVNTRPQSASAAVAPD